MSKEQQVDNRPIGERNYWKLSKKEKEEWVIARGVTPSEDIRKPIALTMIGFIAGFLLGLAILIIHFVVKAKPVPEGESAPLFANPLWIAGAVIAMLAGAGVSIWQLIENKKDGTGFFINNYHINRSNTVKAREAIERDKESEDRFGHESDGSIDELEL